MTIYYTKPTSDGAIWNRQSKSFTIGFKLKYVVLTRNEQLDQSFDWETRIKGISYELEHNSAEYM